MTNTRGVTVKSKYKYVQGRSDGLSIRWFARITGCSRREFIEERDAALVVDRFLISQRKEPVNILVRKKEDSRDNESNI